MLNVMLVRVSKPKTDGNKVLLQVSTKSKDEPKPAFFKVF